MYYINSSIVGIPMAKHGWEKGEIKLPAKAYVRFRKAIRLAFNAQELGAYETAKRVYRRLVEAGKGMRKFNYVAEYLRTERIPGVMGYHRGHLYPVSPRVSELLFGSADLSTEDQDGVRPRNPKKKDLSFGNSQTRAFHLYGTQACILFCDETRSAIWRVAECKHAVEQAHDHPLAKVFFEQLAKVEWVRGTGGDIVGQDESAKMGGPARATVHHIMHRYGNHDCPHR